MAVLRSSITLNLGAVAAVAAMLVFGCNREEAPAKSDPSDAPPPTMTDKPQADAASQPDPPRSDHAGAAKKARACKTGKRCGNSCIPKNKTCRKEAREPPTCKTGKPCGQSCIPKNRTCHQ